MAERSGVSDAALAEGVDHVLKFSRCFFEAFGVKRDRVRYWRLLGLMLRKEREDPEGKVRRDFSKEDIEFVLGTTADASNVPHWRREFVRIFRGPAGAFLEEVKQGPEEVKEAPSESAAGGQAGATAADAVVKIKTIAGHQRKGRPVITKAYRLSRAFDNAAAVYVTGVVREAMALRVAASRLDQVLRDYGTALFKEVLQFIGNRYYPPWLAFLDAAALRLGASSSFKDEFTDHAAYWAITLSCWKQYLINPDWPYSESDLETEVEHALRYVQSDEIERCLPIMVQEKVLIPVENSAPVRYRLNEKCFDLLRRYSADILDAREGLDRLLRSHLN